MADIWKPIAGWPDYEVSADGRVRRAIASGRGHPAGASVGGTFDSDGYRRVTLCREGRKWKVGIHHLVCAAFHGPRPSAAHVAGHWDGDKVNNSAANLRWVTQQENEADKRRHGRSLSGTRHHQAKLTDEQVAEIVAARGVRGAGPKLAERFGVSRTQINRIRRGDSWGASQ